MWSKRVQTNKQETSGCTRWEAYSCGTYPWWQGHTGPINYQECFWWPIAQVSRNKKTHPGHMELSQLQSWQLQRGHLVYTLAAAMMPIGLGSPDAQAQIYFPHCCSPDLSKQALWVLLHSSSHGPTYFRTFLTSQPTPDRWHWNGQEEKEPQGSRDDSVSGRNCNDPDNIGMVLCLYLPPSFNNQKKTSDMNR